MASIGHLLDPFCISLYHASGIPILDYLTGTFLLSVICVVIGEFTLSLAYRVNRRHLMDHQGEMIRMHNLSLEALKHKDKPSYRACNRQANESYGKVFFNTITLSAAALWPAFFALAWMQYRFQGVDVRVAPYGPDLGYPAVFILTYILARILFKRLKSHLPYFRGVQEMLRADGSPMNRMRSLREVFSGDDAPGESIGERGGYEGG